MLNQVLKVFTGIRQHSVEVLSKSVTFLDFWLSQGSVARYCRLGGNLCDVYIDNFSYESPGERILKISLNLPKLLSNIKGFGFFGTWCILKTFFLHRSLYLLVSWAWWDWPLMWLTNNHPLVLWHCWTCWLSHLTWKSSLKWPIMCLVGR